MIRPRQPSWNRSASGSRPRTRELPGHHPDQPQVGADEPLPGAFALVLEQPELEIGRIGPAAPALPGRAGQQPGLDLVLQADHLGGGQQGLVVEGSVMADTMRARTGRPPEGLRQIVDNSADRLESGGRGCLAGAQVEGRLAGHLHRLAVAGVGARKVAVDRMAAAEAGQIVRQVRPDVSRVSHIVLTCLLVVLLDSERGENG